MWLKQGGRRSRALVGEAVSRGVQWGGQSTVQGARARQPRAAAAALAFAAAALGSTSRDTSLRLGISGRSSTRLKPSRVRL